MLSKMAATLAAGLTITAVIPAPSAAQHTQHEPPAKRTQEARPAAQPSDTAGAAARDSLTPHGVADGTKRQMQHQMWMRPLGSGWNVMGMAQAFPTVTGGDPFNETRDLRTSESYLTQPAAMFNIASPGSRVVLRTTLNFEAWTQPGGELTYGGWGEGYIDSRHPHTLLHEFMLSVNAWDTPAGSFSVSAGKGFAPYGTDDPMARPVIKYPTNHHLSQILERWTVNAQYLTPGGLSLEAGLFGGAEPEGPYDFDNINSFGDSWSARLAQRFGDGFGPSAPLELSASYARVAEGHHGTDEITELANVALRHGGAYRFGGVYALAEASRSWPEAGRGYYSLLGETRLGLGQGERHQPYYRVEYATRPEYERQGSPGTEGFFRYDHDAHAIGSTRWLINSVGYGYEASSFPVSTRPYVELQHNHVSAERGGVDPRALFGTRTVWSVSAGVRLFFGGGPMRMGSYGLLDPMSVEMRPGAAMRHGAAAHEGH